jgi:hypothetical protein
MSLRMRMWQDLSQIFRMEASPWKCNESTKRGISLWNHQLEALLCPLRSVYFLEQAPACRHMQCLTFQDMSPPKARKEPLLEVCFVTKLTQGGLPKKLPYSLHMGSCDHKDHLV